MHGLGRLRRGADEQKKTFGESIVFIKMLVMWIRPYWHIVVLGFCCMALSTYLGLQPQRYIGRLIDDVFKNKLQAEFWNVIIILALIYLALAVISWVRTYTLHMTGQKLLHSLRTRIYEKYQKLSVNYYDSKQTGDLMSRVTSDVEQVERMIEHGLDVLLMGILGMLLAFHYVWDINHIVALYMLIPIPIFAVSTFFFNRTIKKIYRSIRNMIGALNGKLQDNLSGIRVIKAFNREKKELSDVEKDSLDVRDLNIKAMLLWSSFGSGMGLLSSLGTLIVLTVGGYFIFRDTLTVGNLYVCLSFVGVFYSPIGSIFHFFDSIQRSTAAGERIFEVLDEMESVIDPLEPETLEEVNGKVELRNVSFKYDTGDMVLKNINLVAYPGETVAIVGKSGAGKTTFVNLIPRFYDATLGDVMIDDVNVKDILQSELRKHIAIVLQDTFLFNTSVMENIRFGRDGATDEEIVEAAKIANADEFIRELVNGYDTEIGERGVKLSGGQKQRIAIARAVLKNPQIVILDEATSAIDTESEMIIHNAMENLMEGRTTFVIAHRLSTIKNADTILVISDGNIVEQGNHADLMNDLNSNYYEMYTRQSEGLRLDYEVKPFGKV